MAIVVGTNSWVTEAEANTYMADRLRASLYWTDADSDNAPALITAYQWLTNSSQFNFPAIVVQAMKDMQFEMALFLLQHQPDIDLRTGLQAQGVTKAGIVKEDYRTINGIPIPLIVFELGSAYTTEEPGYIVDIERDEEQLTSYDAPSNLDRNT